MNLKNQIDKFKESTKLQIQKKNEQTSLTFNNATRLLEGRQWIWKIYMYIFPVTKQAQGETLKKLNPKQIL